MKVWVVCTEYDHEPFVEGAFTSEDEAAALRDHILEMRKKRRQDGVVYTGGGPRIIGPVVVFKTQEDAKPTLRERISDKLNGYNNLVEICDGQGWKVNADHGHRCVQVDYRNHLRRCYWSTSGLTSPDCIADALRAAMLGLLEDLEEEGG